MSTAIVYYSMLGNSEMIANMAGYVKWNHTPVFDNLYSKFNIMLGVMFIISSIILIVPKRKK